ncbi:MAG: chromosome segregation protein SMC [Clostridiales bacterium]|nr:chromosome segregation protein SMC [Clostridiales bacterium]
MKFKKIEVYGFKSFADKLSVEFGEGITAIVGPNGCGKSNVADSIRWVLGEQSAKLLRGTNMQDVIFKGTEKRKSMSFCEVLLYFDNTDKLFPSLEFSEVVLSRKLYRSGESQYLINGTPCRLKDITDLLRDGGMGREGYSIIGQGRIDELLSAKPEDRRAIFEEAAGISKFKARKLESERKLVRTRDNMSRVNDILLEKGRQLEPLTKQAETAQKYLNLRDQLRYNEINTYIYQYDTANVAKEAINNRLNGVTEELELRQHEFDELLVDYRKTLDSREYIDKDIETLRDKLVELTVGIANQAADIRLLNQQLTHINENTAALKDENVKLNVLQAENSKLLETRTQDVKKLSEELKSYEVIYDQKNAEYLSVSDELTANADEIASARKEELDAIEKLADIKANMSRYIAEREALNERVTEFGQRIIALKSRIKELEPKIEELSVAVSEIKEQKGSAQKRLDGLYTTNNELLYKVNSLAVDIDKLSNTYHTKNGQYKILRDMKESYDAYNNSVKNLLLDSKKDKEISSRIEGVVAELITVEPKFETAIEMALGGAVQNIVVRTDDDAKYLVEHLKRTRHGRVTFLPMNAVKPRDIDSKYLHLIEGNGCYGKASDVIKYNAKYSRVVESLLGATVIVENMDAAIRLSKSTGYSFRVVTLDGDIINPQGYITGGSKTGDRNISNIFTYERELNELTVEVSDIESRLAALNSERSSLVENQKTVDAEIKQLRDLIHGWEIDEASKSESLTSMSTECEQAQKDLIAVEYQYNRDDSRIEEITASIDSVGELEELIKSKRAEASELNESKQKYIDELRARHDKLREEVTNLLIKINSHRSAYDSAVNEIDRIKNEIQGQLIKLEANSLQIETNEKEKKAIDVKLSALTAQTGESDTDKVKAIKDKLAELDEYKKNLVFEIDSIDKKRTEYTNLLQSLNERKMSEEYQLQKVDTDIEMMENNIREQYDLDYQGCLVYKAEKFEISEGTTAINKLKRQIAALGNINLDAIEQCKVVYEEYHNLDEQKRDLEKAEADLVKIINDLSADMIKIFSTQFEQIRLNFIKIFKELFDGGNADLLLLESEDPLAAGVEIVAQPPQKKLQSISLLSGGERALTAIAILFAILRLKPMPFCVLDEIEAALDDANASRFAQYLRRFSEETQFIVITHRKPTMELSDNLYGVTMEERGVSKIVSVKLSEAVKQATHAANEGA